MVSGHPYAQAREFPLSDCGAGSRFQGKLKLKKVIDLEVRLSQVSQGIERISASPRLHAIRGGAQGSLCLVSRGSHPKMGVLQRA